MRLFRLSLVVLLAISIATPALAQQRTRRKRATRRPAAAKPPTIPQLGVTTASGLTYVVTKHGTGRKPLAGETVVVHYTGTLTDGTKFDSSHDRNDPIEFPLGMGRVIKGWDEGISLLSVGDRAVLVIPPDLGYGAKGAGGVIPPDATLVFVVELVDVKAAGASR
jgi:FKBP-type peptidyl-prolyl cis-trans isomerase